MIPYLIPFVISILCAVRYDINNRKDGREIVCYGFLYIYLTLLIGLRYKVGGDSLTYEGVFSVMGDLSTWSFNFNDIYEPGFKFLYALAKSLSPNFVCFQLIHVTFLNTLLFIFVFKQTKYRFLALTIIEYAVYLYFTTEVMRESLAVLIFALNYPNYRRKRWIRYYLGVFISITFHISASFLLLLPIFYSIKFNKKFVIVCGIIILLLPVLNKVFGTFTDNLIAERVNRYRGEFYGFLTTIIYILSGAVFPFLILVLSRHKRKELRFENPICIQVILGLASLANPIIFGRLTNYFVLFFLLTLTEYFQYHLRSRYKHLRTNSYIIILLFFLSYSSQYLHMHKYVRYIPYSSIINPINYNRDYTLE